MQATLTVSGTPIAIIFSDSPKTNNAKITVAVPGTKMVLERTVVGGDLRLRASAAGNAIAGIVSNFIENNPVMVMEEGFIQIEDRTASYPFPIAMLGLESEGIETEEEPEETERACPPLNETQPSEAPPVNDFEAEAAETQTDDAIRAEAKELGIPYSHNKGIDKLKEEIIAKKAMSKQA